MDTRQDAEDDPHSRAESAAFALQKLAQEQEKRRGIFLYAVHGFTLLAPGVQNPAQSAEPCKQQLCTRRGIHPRNAIKQKSFQQLCFAEFRSAARNDGTAYTRSVPHPRAR